MNSVQNKEEVIKRVSIKTALGDCEDSRFEEKRMSPFISSEESLEKISYIIGRDLELVNTEVSVGDFRADIICKDINSEEIIVIENQLGKTDHNHIGKAVTYLSNFDAKSIIWICEKSRPEHIKAIEKLNEITNEEYSFYLFEIVFEQYKHDNPYWYFNEVFVPSSINKISSSIKNTKSESFVNNYLFFEKLIEKLKPYISSVHLNPGKSYHKICTIKNIWFVVKGNLRTNATVFEIGYDKRKAKGDIDVAAQYEEILKAIENELN